MANIVYWIPLSEYWPTSSNVYFIPNTLAVTPIILQAHLSLTLISTQNYGVPSGSHHLPKTTIIIIL